MNKNILFLAGAVLFASALAPASAPQDVPKSGLPILTTSAGQSTDVTTLNIVMEEAGIPYDYCDVPTPEMLADGVGLGDREEAPGFHVEIYTDLAKFPKGTPYKSVVIAIGASLKGMGASGLTVESEASRLKQVIDYCKKNRIFIVAIHVGGDATRGASGSDNERMIDAVAPFADYLIVTKDSNKDGRFTKISRDGNIPLTEIEYALGLVELLKKVFL